jgi:hypothetical protein
MENENEIINSELDTDTTENEVDIDIELEEVQDEASDEDAEVLKKKIATLEAQKEHWRKKANEKKAETPATPSSLASKDLIALMNAKVHEDDISEVEDYAKYRGISIAEALKSSVVKTLLSERAEQRNTAIATNTSKARPSSSRVPDDVILKNAAQGKLPDDIDALVNARFNAKKNK